MKVTSKTLPNGNTEVRYWDALKQKYVRSQHKSAAATKAKVKEITSTLSIFGQSALLTPTEQNEYRQAKALLPEGVSLVKAVMDFLDLSKEGISSIPLTEAVEAYLAQLKPGVASNHYTSVERYLRQFVEFVGATKATALVTPKIVQSFMDSLDYGAWTLNGVRRKVSAFFSWADRKDFCSGNPVEKVDTVRVPKGAVDFYSVDQISALLAEAEASDPGIIPAIALSVFAGLRSSEAQALLQTCPENIRFDERTIYLPPEVVKGDHDGTSRGRLLQGLPEAIWTWLEGRELKVADYLFRVRKVREAAELPVIHSGFRKTALTHFSQLYSIDQVAQWAGHTSGRTTLAHYVGIVTKQEAARFLDLTPESVSP